MMFWPWGMGMSWLLLPFMIFWVIVAFLAVIFWLWMLVDCLTRRKFEDKLVWVLVLILLNIIGAILYYFLIKSKRTRRFE